MISAGEFRNGVTFEQDGQVLQVVEFQHVKPGKGAAFVRTKTKNVITGAVIETSYNPTAKFPQAFIERKEVTYSYFADPHYVWMDEEYNQYEVDEDTMEDAKKYLQDDLTAEAVFYEGRVIGIELPTMLVREVVYTEPAVKGDTSGKVMKPARLATGFTLDVPAFVNTGDKIEIDTRTNEYRSRIK